MGSGLVWVAMAAWNGAYKYCLFWYCFILLINILILSNNLSIYYLIYINQSVNMFIIYSENL